MRNIHVNQCGYRPWDKKVFVCRGTAEEFQVINKVNNEIVLRGKMGPAVYDQSTDETVVRGDFSELKTPGEYYISVENLGDSFSFKIGNNVYEDVKDGLLKALYMQRCGTELVESHAGKWSHEICHTSKGVLYEAPEIEMEITGGWHDAGDYGRYVVPAGKAVADLLLAYEFFPEAFKNEINIPESGNNLPDILNEAKYELDWLFKMQNANNGGVYHKATTQFFCGMIMPEKDLAPIVIYPISSPATADFAATMAYAARVYEKFDKEYSRKCLEAAEKAWTWLKANPEPVLFKNPPNMNSGEYGDKSDLDERYWASAELYKTTGNTEYHEYFEAAFKELKDTNSLGWADMAGYGSITYLFTERSMVDSEVYAKVKAGFIDKARALVSISQKDGYKVTRLPEGYIWGSNMNILNNAMHLVIADILESNNAFIETAFSQWNYLLGANSLSQCYVTGYGSKPIMHPHHRPSEDDGITEPVPGLVSGGPCRALLDPAAKAHCGGKAPAKCFIDDAESYSTNEIAIYWNSPAVFVAGFVNLKMCEFKP
ncbi:MAG: glycoside hydrolase family 9 protein [Bacillota bacterium]|nr:glycoside hydrolase family 9 protein [Bacillota bacterium]